MHPRRHAALLFVAAALLAPLVVSAGDAESAMAHDYATGSTPADGAVLTELPAEFDLSMNEDMLDLGGAGNGFALQIIGPDGLYYGDGCVTIDGPRMSTPAGLGAAGDYRMVWQIVSADGHPVSDEYDFTWAPTADTVESGGSKTPPVCGVLSKPTDSASPTPAASEPGTSVSDESTSDASAPPTDPLTPALLVGGAILAAAAVIASGFVAVRRRSRKL